MNEVIGIKIMAFSLLAIEVIVEIIQARIISTEMFTKKKVPVSLSW